MLLHSRLQGVITFGNYVLIFIPDLSKLKSKIIVCLVPCTYGFPSGLTLFMKSNDCRFSITNC